MRSFIILVAALCCPFWLVAQVIDPGFDRQVYEAGDIAHIAFDSQGNTYITGVYELVNGKPRTGITKLNTTGQIIEDFETGSGSNGTVKRLISLSTDKLLVIGDFTEFNGVATGPMVQIDLDGAVDETFATATNILSPNQNSITNVIELSNGKLLIYGSFTSYNGFDTNSIVVLNPDGTVDESFDYQNENVLSVVSVTLQSSEKMVVALSRNNGQSDYITRLNADGSKDEAFIDFDAGARKVYKIMAQSTDKLVVLTDVPEADQLNADLFRLNADGTSDETFDLGEGIIGFFDDFQLEDDDDILIGTVRNGIIEGIIDRNFTGLICRLLADGSFDKSFVRKNYLSETTRVIQNKVGRPFIYGHFLFLQTVNTNSIAKFTNSGESDYSWRADLKSVAETVLVEKFGNNPIIIPRFQNRLENVQFARRLFSPVDPMRNPHGRPFDVEEIRVVKRFPEIFGQLVYGGGPLIDRGQNFVFFDQWQIRSTSFDALVANDFNDNWVNDVEMKQNENRTEVFVAGSFSGIHGQTDGVAGILKFTSDARRDDSFISPFNADSVKINDIELQDDGKVIVAGAFAPAGENNLGVGIARLNMDGSFDETFDRSLNFTGGIIQNVEIVSDGYIVVGDFTDINSSESRRGIAKINLDGTLNTEFNANNTWVGNKIYQVVVEENAIYLGGDFTEYQGQAVSGLIKLDLDGNLDNDFRLPDNLSALVRDFNVNPDDEINIIMAGRFYDSESNTKLSAVRLSEGIDGAPFDLTVGNVTYDEVNLSWQESSTNEERYIIERSKGDQQNFEELTWVNGNTTAYIDDRLYETGTTYYYRVRAAKDNFRSEYSNVVEVAVPQKPLATPTDLAIWFYSGNLVRLSWKEWSLEEAGFSIERSINDQESFVEIGSVDANETEFDDTNIEQEANYFYRVKAYKGEFSSEYSNSVEVLIPLTLPAPPSNLLGTVISEDQIDLTWTDNSNNEDSFLIFKDVNQEGYKPIGPLPKNQTSYSDTDIRLDQILTYYVVAINSEGTSSASNSFVEKTLPVAPSDLMGTVVSDNRIELSWVDNSFSEAFFVIDRSVNQDEFEIIGIVPANRTNYSDEDVDVAQTVEYMVRASNSAGYSQSSSILRMVIANIDEGFPGQDSRFDFTHDPITDDLSFKLNNQSDRITAYQVVSSSGVIKTREEGLEAQQLNLNLSGNAPGIYLLYVVSERDKYIVKMIKN